jgi:hypothetical protein
VTIALSPDDALAQIRVCVQELAGEDRSAWAGPARAARVLELAATVERLEAELVRAIGDWDRDRAWQADEATSAATWLAHHGELATGTATRLVQSARLARAHDRVGDALASGDVTATAVGELARVERHREELFERDVEVLVEAAANLAPRDLSVALRRWRYLADDAASTDDRERVYERRYLFAFTTIGGTVRIDGELDPEGGARFLAALDRHTRPDPTDDPLGARTLAQLRADALVDVADAAMGGAAGTPARPVVEVIIDADTLEGRRAQSLDRARCDILGCGPIPVETARRILCDSAIGRIVMSSGEVLDVGRRLRFPTAAQRRAVIARDRHCVWPGCGRPARWCDVPHVVAVRDGGRTVVVELVLLCRRHHTALHERGWTLTRHDDGRIEVRRPAPVDRGPP